MLTEEGKPMRLSRLAALAATIVLLVAGCGGSGGTQGIASVEGATGDSTSTTAAAEEVDSEQAMLDYAQCMRDNGVDMEDPTADENGNFQMMRPSGGGENGEFDPADREAMQAAQEACSQYLEGITQQFQQVDMTEMQDLMLEYAQCMRDNGVDMEDPDFTTDEGGGMGAGGRLGFDMSQHDTSDPVFQAASEACQEIFGSSGLPGMMMGGGPGGPGGAPPDGGMPPDDLTPPSDGG
jgi:hypothetical protein